jgi:CDP-glycerol glycerophosphotransferase (TagB/SpsB family)
LQYDKYNFSKRKLINKKTRKALYLSTALRTTGVSPITIEEEKMFYQKLFKQVNKAGYKLILKLHPLEDPLLFKSYFNGMDVEIHSNVNLADLCFESDLVIGEYTTTFFYAIREKKPIIIINSNYFNEYPFDFTKFGIGFKSDIDELAIIISKNKNLTRENKLAYEKFSRNYINYDGSSYIKIYNHIENILDYN